MQKSSQGPPDRALLAPAAAAGPEALVPQAEAGEQLRVQAGPSGPSQGSVGASGSQPERAVSRGVRE